MRRSSTSSTDSSVGYAGWIVEQKRIASGLRSTGEQVAANRICDRMSVALDRMRACVETLRADPTRSGVVPVGESGDARPDAKGRSHCRQGDRTGRLPLAPLSVGLPAHGHGVRDSGRRRVSRRAGSHLVSHRRRQDRGVPGSDRVSDRLASSEVPRLRWRHRGPHALYAAPADPAAVRTGGPHGMRPGADSKVGPRAAWAMRRSTSASG